MRDDNKTKEQLVHELTELFAQNAALKKSITGHISAELASEEARRYAESILETVREPLLVMDADLKIISANRSFYRTFKVTPGETIGSFIYDLGNKQWDIPKLRELLEEVLPEKERFDDFEVTHNFQDIGHKIMLLNARQISRKDIGAKMILLAIEDITERKEIEAGLEKTRKELAFIKIAADEVSEYAESVVNAVREPLIILDQDLRVVTASRSFYKFFMVKPEETVGQLIYDLGNRQWDIPKLRELLETILPEKVTFDNYEVEHDFTTIGRRTMLLNARQIQRVLGKERVILLAIEDITEQKRLENLLTESEERYRRLFETASDGIVLLEKREGKITHANPATEKMLGYTKEESIGNKLQGIGVSLDMEDFQTTMKTLNESGIINYDGVSVKTKSGQHIDTDIYLVDRSTLVQCNIRDITDRKQAEDEREKMLLWQQGVNLLQQSLLAPGKLEEKLRTITDSIVTLFDADFSRIWLIKPGDLCEQGCVHEDVLEGPHICLYRDRCLHLLASSGRYTHTDGAIYRRVPFGCYKIGRIASGDDHKFLTNDAQNDPRVHNHEWVCELGLVSFVGYQIRVPGGKTLGVLALFAKHLVSPTEDAMLDGLSSTVARVVQRDVAEKLLRDSEEKHRLLFDSAGDAIFVHDAVEAQMLAVNTMACERLGYTHAELISMTIDQVDSPAEALFAPDRMARLMEHGHLTFETVHQRKDGSLIPTDVIARRIAWDGQPAIMNICRDITSRKLAEESLRQTTEKLRKSLSGTIQAMSLIVETRDPYTAGHQRKVSNLARAVAQEMGLSNDTVDTIRMAGTIHDIGKISVPAEILSKPGILTNIEMSLVKAHSQTGYDILKDVGLPYPMVEIILQHHERLDGSGYPKGLKDGQILLESRIISVADVIEAIASHRPYRPALGIDAALEEIEKNAGVLYYREVVEACLKLFREKQFSFEF